MEEIVANLHMHTTYSDGYGHHSDIAEAALRSGIDAVIVTDHNVWVNGVEKYVNQGDKRVLLLIGEEIHDQTREPQKNHLLVLNANTELATHASEPQKLIDAVNRVGGLSFLAHPHDPPAPAINEGDLSWVDWDIRNFTGIELWNAMTEMKSLVKSKLHGFLYAFNPKRVARGPFPETIKIWDELLAKGMRVVAIGGSDAHALQYKLGPIRKEIFPYEFHFKAVNTHLLLNSPLSGQLIEDRDKIYTALSKGHAFIGYDLPTTTHGFRFTAHGKEETVIMGDAVSAKYGITFQIRLPFATECNLIRDGNIVKTWKKRQNCTYITSDTGVYRVEVYIRYLGMRRGWIFSNPIYVTE